MLIGIAAALLACFGYGVASVLQAHGARSSAAASLGEDALVTSDGRPTLRSTANAVLTSAFIAGMALDVIGFAGSVVSARLIPLFLSQTIISANLVVTAVLGVAVLGLRLRGRDWTAIGTVMVSLCVLAFGAGQAGTASVPGLHWALMLVAMLIAALGVVLIRLLGARAAVAAGLVSGVLYGVMAIAVRVVDGVDPLKLPVLLMDPAFWAIAIAGAAWLLPVHRCIAAGFGEWRRCCPGGRRDGGARHCRRDAAG